MPNETQPPRRGNHFSGGPKTNNTPQPRRPAGPSETAEFTSAYFQSGNRSVRSAAGSTPQNNASARPARPQAQASTHQGASPRNSYAATPTNGAPRSNSIPYGSARGGGRSSYSSQTPKRGGRGKIVAGIIGALVAIIVVVGGVCGFFMYRDYKDITAKVPTLVEQASTLKDAVMAGDGDTVRNTAAAVSTDVADMHNRLEGIPWQLASIVPVVGQDVQSVRTLMSEADRLCQYALIPACDSLAEAKLSNLVSDGAINVDLLESLVSTLQNISPVIEQSAETIEALPVAHIGKVGEIITKVQDAVHMVNGAITSVNEIAPYLPQMLGGDGVRNYLLIAQTNSEIHSTGGHPGAIGLLSVSNGQIQLGEFIAATELERYDSLVYATQEEAALFSGAGTIPTSGNIIPDFSRAAYILGEMWKDQRGGNLDGVIGIDPILLQNLLKGTPGITTSSGIAVNGDNAASLLLHDSYQTMPIEQTDIFFAEVANAAFDTVLGNLGSIGMPQLLSTITDAIDTRHLQVFMYNENEQSAMGKLGCTGTLNDDETSPEVGVFVSDATWSKISWYLSVNTAVSEGTVNADGTTTYHVTSTFKNNLNPADASSLVDYVTGYNPAKRDITDMINYVYIVAPAGGSISNMVCTDDSGAQAALSETSYEGHQMFTNTIQILGSKSVTYSYDVTVSANAENPLGVDTTPTAQTAAGWQ